MFKILGADGKEYGPVTVDQIKQWIKDGRANHETMAEKMGEIGWKPLAQYADFASQFATQPPVMPSGPAGAAAVNGPAADARARALSLVNGPAIALIATAILGMVMNGIGIVVHLMGRGFVPPMYEMNPDVLRVIQIFNGPMGLVVRIIPLAIGLFVLFGALKMQQLRSRGLAMTATIVAMIPCFSPCCLLGLPFGIWALIVLSKPEVQSQFDR
jgi:hypothetical protein